MRPARMLHLLELRRKVDEVADLLAREIKQFQEVASFEAVHIFAFPHLARPQRVFQHSARFAVRTTPHLACFAVRITPHLARFAMRTTPHSACPQRARFSIRRARSAPLRIFRFEKHTNQQANPPARMGQIWHPQ